MAIRDTSVICYSYADSGMSGLAASAGALIAVLDAVLINGYGTITADSLVVSGGIATLTKSAGHGFTNPGAAAGIDVGCVVLVEGVTGALSGLNARWRATVTSLTVLTWECGLADGTASGTITAKKPPLGFSKPYSGTNIAVYRADDVQSNRAYLRIDDSGTTYARVRGYEAMTSSADTGTGPFPTDGMVSGGYYWPKSPDSTPREWQIVGDSRGFVIKTTHSTTPYFAINAWTEVQSDRPADAYCTLLTGGQNTTITNAGALYYLGAGGTTHAIARSHTYVAGAIQAGKYAAGISTQGTGYAGDIFPSIAGSRYLCVAVDVWESATVRRGVLPGVYGPLHAGTAVPDNAAFILRGVLDGKKVLHWRMQNGGSHYAVAVDVSGPWR